MADLPEMVEVPGGTFLMGNDQGRPDEQPAHLVTVSPFRAAITPVTNAQWDAFCSATGVVSHDRTHGGTFADPGMPVVRIDWFEAVSYCEWLRQETGRRFRLPTEAEREWAARGGRPQGDWPWEGDENAHPAIDAIYPADGPHVPGEGCANGYGLRCMADNVHEWCSDWYDATYYAKSPQDNPKGPPNGTRRASRGGSWRHSIKVTRVNARSSLGPLYHYADFGFRVYE